MSDLPSRLRELADDQLASIDLGGRCECPGCAWLLERAKTCREAADALERADSQFADMRRQMEEARDAGEWPLAKVLADRDEARAKLEQAEKTLREIAYATAPAMFGVDIIGPPGITRKVHTLARDTLAALGGVPYPGYDPGEDGC